jgi:signal transduction histidine kinase
MVMTVPMVDRLRAGAGLLLRPTGPPPRPTRRGRAFDAVLALVLGVTAGAAAKHGVAGSADHIVSRVGLVVHPLGTGGERLSVAVTIAVIIAAPLVFRRRFPLAVLWIVMGATLLIVHDTPRGAFYACVIAAYTAAAYSPYRALTLASLSAAALLVSLFRNTAVPAVPDKYVPFLILIPIGVAANGMRIWRRRADDGRAELAALERTQVEALHRAAEHERARIARELHDVVTHNVSVMVIQAGAARKVMHTAPDQATEALLAVEAGGRAAMAELRQVMGLLTMDTDSPDAAADLAPQPGLDRLPDLLGPVRDTGVPVELTVAGQPRPVPTGIELAAYRVVQEALTNMVKHAVGAAATVIVEYGADQLRVEVTDTGGRPDASAATGDRRGLIGLRERLAVYGGTLHTGPRPSGGFRVEAVIPLEAP